MYPGYAPTAGFYPPPIAEHHHHYEAAAEPAPEAGEKASKKTQAVSEKPTVVVEKEVAPKSVVREGTPEPDNESPNSSVLRAIASANEQASADKVRD